MNGKGGKDRIHLTSSEVNGIHMATQTIISNEHLEKTKIENSLCQVAAAVAQL